MARAATGEGVELQIVDGELVARSHNAMLGYDRRAAGDSGQPTLFLQTAGSQQAISLSVTAIGCCSADARPTSLMWEGER